MRVTQVESKRQRKTCGRVLQIADPGHTHSLPRVSNDRVGIEWTSQTDVRDDTRKAVCIPVKLGIEIIAIGLACACRSNQRQDSGAIPRHVACQSRIVNRFRG